VGVVLETVQEYFWRLLIDWPQAMGRESLATPVATARHSIAASARDADGTLAWTNVTRMRELGATLAGIAARSIYGMPPGEWLRIDDLARLDAWARRETTLPAALIAELLDEAPDLARSDVSLMPAAPDALVATVVPAMASEPSFSQAPTWGGSPVETGALARMCTQPLVAAADARYGHAVATRMIARLAELATLLDALVRGAIDDGSTPAIQAFTLATGEGFAAVQTARGLLLHRVRLEQERVADYQIVAPTEWNFHPRGALVSGLSRLASEDAFVLSRHARLAVQALDPCVECRIEIGHA
jgi:uptake hydrogenase large subunit